MTQTNKHTKFMIFSVSLISLLLAIANIIASNTVATTGKKLQLLHQKTTELQSQNLRLEKLIAEKKSLTSIQIKAEELGLKPIVQTLNLTTPKPLAQLP